VNIQRGEIGEGSEEGGGEGGVGKGREGVVLEGATLSRVIGAAVVAVEVGKGLVIEFPGTDGVGSGCCGGGASDVRGSWWEVSARLKAACFHLSDGPFAGGLQSFILREMERKEKARVS